MKRRYQTEKLHQQFKVYRYIIHRKIVNIGTYRYKQTVQTPIRLLNEQSDQGLHCLPFYMHLLDAA